MRALLAALTVSAILAPSAAGTAVRPGLHGVVHRGPTMPVCLVGSPCSAPAAHVRLAFVRNGVTRTVTTDARGRYSIALRAGRYAVRIAVRAESYTPTHVRVPAGRSRLQNFQVDTGIR